MIWLASFPRSGNTFFRNILFEVYGLESSTFHLDDDYHKDANYTSYPFVKTHLLPSQLIPGDPDIKSVCIIRDGRDALCSMAHHRKDIVAPGSDYYENLKAAIIAEKGSFFGGWSQNVSDWLSKADVVIRYEDLLVDPVHCAERLRKIMDLPEADPDKLPSFSQMKFGIPQYGSGRGRGYNESKMKALAEKNFRKGKAGSWKTEMPKELQDLFWSYHGDMMDKLGYSLDGTVVNPHEDLDFEVYEKLGIEREKTNTSYSVLIEANKLVNEDNDGVKRYLVELLKNFAHIDSNPASRWKFLLLVNNKIHPIDSFFDRIRGDFKSAEIKANTDQSSKPQKTVLQRLDETFVKTVPKRYITYLEERDIRIFHKIYNTLIKIVFWFIYLLVDVPKKIIAFTYGILQDIKQRLYYRKLADEIKEYDLIHIPLQQHYRPFVRAKNKILVTIHDFTHRFFPQHHTGINIKNAENGINFIRKKNAAVLAVSDSTRSDTLKELNMNESDVYRVYEAADKEKFHFVVNRDETAKIKSKYGIPGNTPYFLCLSTIEPRKNLDNTVKALIKLAEENSGIHVKLVVAGKMGWHTNKMYLRNKLFTEYVHYTGFINDEDLSAIYSEALALCYLSYYEGFGLPPLEAMNCATPVIFGDNSSLPEVVGNGGLAADPNNIDEIKNRMHDIYFNKDLRKELSANALQQSLRFSWRKAGIETLDVYKDIINK